ncbi:MAG: hypothetical protein ABJG68_05225 [Crocinitomicaceae bacterium]
MKLIKLYILFIFSILSFNSVLSQDSLRRFSAEGEVKVVPLMSSFYSGFRFYNISTEANDSGLTLINKPTNFRPSLNLRLNVTNKSQSFYFGVGFKYAPVKNYWNKLQHPDSTSSIFITENIKTDYIGGTLRFLFDPIKDIKIIGGFTIGGGKLFGRSSEVQVTNPVPPIASPGNSKKIKYDINEPTTMDLGYQIELWDLYLNYTFQYLFNTGKNLTFYVGFEIPFLRLFFYNSQVKTGLELNNDSFFTSLQNFTPIVGDQSSGNKNLAYSLKKTHTSSLNFGIRYHFGNY